MQPKPLGDLVGIPASAPERQSGEPLVVQGFRDFVLTLPETLQVFVTTGSEDLLVHVAVPSPTALQDFVLDSLTRRREVAGLRTEVVYDHVRNHVVAPIGD